MRALFVLLGLLLASPVVAQHPLQSFLMDSRHMYPNGIGCPTQQPGQPVAPALVSGWANYEGFPGFNNREPIYIRKLTYTLSGPMGLRSDTGVHITLFHPWAQPLGHQSVDWYAEPDGPMRFEPFNFAPDFVQVNYGEYIWFELGCAPQPGNTANPPWIAGSVVVHYTHERPTAGRPLYTGWIDTNRPNTIADESILDCTPNGTPTVVDWTNPFTAVTIRLLNLWPGISQNARVRATGEVWALRAGQPPQPLLVHTWNRFAEPSGPHDAVEHFIDDVRLNQGDGLRFSVACKGAGKHQQNLLFFFGVG